MTILKLTLSSDKVLGLFGGGLATGSAAFGLFMSIHGPVGSGPSHDFTVFAQLSPRAQDGRAHAPSTADDLDTTATASIRKTDAAGSEPEPTILAGIVLRSTGNGTADVSIDGRLRHVRVGDTIPGAGEILAIVSGPRPMLRTSRGLIVADEP